MAIFASWLEVPRSWATIESLIARGGHKKDYTTREFVTGPTVLQQKIVERFSHLGRVEAVDLQQKSVVSIMLNRLFG